MHVVWVLLTALGCAAEHAGWMRQVAEIMDFSQQTEIDTNSLFVQYHRFGKAHIVPLPTELVLHIALHATPDQKPRQPIAEIVGRGSGVSIQCLQGAGVVHAIHPVLVCGTVQFRRHRAADAAAKWTIDGLNGAFLSQNATDVVLQLYDTTYVMDRTDNSLQIRVSTDPGSLLLWPLMNGSIGAEFSSPLLNNEDGCLDALRYYTFVKLLASHSEFSDVCRHHLSLGAGVTLQMALEAPLVATIEQTTANADGSEERVRIRLGSNEVHTYCNDVSVYPTRTRCTRDVDIEFRTESSHKVHIYRLASATLFTIQSIGRGHRLQIGSTSIVFTENAVTYHSGTRQLHITLGNVCVFTANNDDAGFGTIHKGRDYRGSVLELKRRERRQLALASRRRFKGPLRRHVLIPRPKYKAF